MESQLRGYSQPTSYALVMKNRSFALLCGGQMISTIGDIFFNLTVMWVIYAQSHSVFQTALIQVCWHLSSTLFSMFAGAWVDRYDRKLLLLGTNLLSAIVVGIVAILIHIQGYAAPLVVFVTIFVLNSVGTIFGPALYSMLPEIVGRESMSTASGLFTSIKQGASLTGSFIAGITITFIGASWAVGIDALSFVVAALAVVVAQLPAHTNQFSPASSSQKGASIFRDVSEGWRAIADRPIIKSLLWLVMLINVVSFMGPLAPALISQRLHGDASAFGIIQMAGFFGAILGGALVGKVERRVGAGRLLAWGLALSGLFTVGIAFSTLTWLTACLEALSTGSLTAGSIAISSLLPTLVPEEFRGRVQGIISGMAVGIIPISSLAGGYLADRWGVVALVAFGGIWLLSTAFLVWCNRHIRTVNI